MKKPIVVIPAVTPKNKNLDKFGGWDWMDISKKAWKYWCDKHGYQLVMYDKCKIDDLDKYRVTVQRWFDIHDFLEEKGIEYSKVLMVDASTVPKWDCPDFFKLTTDNLCVSRDMDNLKWTYESVIGYKSLFNNYELNISKYFNSGFVIFNESHRGLFKKFKEHYINNFEQIYELQNKIVKRGTCQTPLNYCIQMNNIKPDFLPAEYRVSHLTRKEILGHNWQLDGSEYEDKTPFFIKYGYTWVFSGFDKSVRNSLMTQTWDLVKHNYTSDKNEILLNSVRHKDNFRMSTSRKFKKDLIDFFSGDKFKEMTMVELGCCHGDTTKVFSSLFKSVHAVDWKQENIDKAKEMCDGCDNITYQVSNVVEDEWDYPKADVVFIDASHDYPQVAIDIEKTITYFNNPIIVMDDYGNSVNNNVRKSIDDKIKENRIKIEKLIGEQSGFKTKSGWEMNDREGVICQII